MLPVAVVGAGAFGRNHLRVIRESARAELAGVFDIDVAKTDAAAAEFACTAYRSLEEVATKAKAAVIASPTETHCSVATVLLKAGLDVMVEKPIAADLETARLIESAAGDRIVQVGHLERFNPAVQALRKILTVPLFFEVHRMSVFTPRSLDVDVVLDLMIHDLELVLSMTGMMPEDVQAAGIRILSKKVDIANVRLAFANGCIANLAASRVSTERIRKMRVFQPHQYISIDYTRQDGACFTVSAAQQIAFQPLAVTKIEPLKAQFDAFLDSIENRTPPLVGAPEAVRALQVALHILDKIEEHARLVAKTLGESPPQ